MRRRAALVPIALALLVLGVCTAVFATRAGRPGGALAFAVLGTSNTPGNRGYDGQYYYRLAVDPLAGRRGLDRPAYRSQRILYPLLAHAAALGDRERVPAAMVLINGCAVAVGTLCLALLLRLNGISPLLSLGYAAYVGTVACFWRDLAEPVAYALIGAALVVWHGRRPGLTLALLLLALLAKEATLLFVAAFVAHLALRRAWRALGALVATVIVPYALWQLALSIAFGQMGLAGTDRPPRLPLGGLAGVRDHWQLLLVLLAVVTPTLLCLDLIRLGWRAAWHSAHPDAGGGSLQIDSPVLGHLSRLCWALSDLPTLALLANVLFVLWLPAPSYADLWASSRNADGVVLAALAHPALAQTRPRPMLVALWVACAPLLWL